MEIPIVGGAYEGRSKNLNSQMCQNLYPVVDQTGKKTAALMSTPGLSSWVALSGGSETRAMEKADTVLYIVSGNKVFSVTTGGTPTELTGTLNTTSGIVFMAYNDNYVVIVDPADGVGYYIDRTTTTVAKITDADFPTATSLTYQDQFFCVTAADTGRIYISTIGAGNIGDPTSWNALDYAAAEGAPDFLVVVRSHLRELWAFGVDSTEIWYNSGDADYPFDRVPGSFSNKGLGARFSVAEADDRMFFLGHDWSVYVTEGYKINRISTDQIDYKISKVANKSTAIGFAYVMEGKPFYVLTFPSDNLTLSLDFSTGVWHTRASGVNESRHPVNCAVQFSEKIICGHYLNGKLLYYDFDTYTDDGEMLIRKRRAKAVDVERREISHHILEIEFEAGIGLQTGQGSDPQAMLRWSDDGGHTWSYEHWVGIGKVGKYKNRARWKKLGRSRERVYEVSISDPVPVRILSADLAATVGMY